MNSKNYQTFPSEYPRTELRTKSGGEIESTRATISGFSSSHKWIIPSDTYSERFELFE